MVYFLKLSRCYLDLLHACFAELGLRGMPIKGCNKKCCVCGWSTLWFGIMVAQFNQHLMDGSLAASMDVRSELVE